MSIEVSLPLKVTCQCMVLIVDVRTLDYLSFSSFHEWERCFAVFNSISVILFGLVSWIKGMLRFFRNIFGMEYHGI